MAASRFARRRQKTIDFRTRGRVPNLPRCARTGGARPPATRIWSPISTAVVWSGLSLLPDADVYGFRLGVKYADPWGHRGATHSLLFTLGVALVVGLIAKLARLPARLPARRITLIAAVVLVSHPLLDTLTDGGLGCALLWPFSNERFFAPWTPLPVAPIGRDFLSAEGLRVAVTELVLMAPLLAYALWPARRRGLTSRGTPSVRG